MICTPCKCYWSDRSKVNETDNSFMHGGICDMCIDLQIINVEEKGLYEKQRCGWDNNTKTNVMSEEWINP
jgi:hypothetical protein